MRKATEEDSASLPLASTSKYKGEYMGTPMCVHIYIYNNKSQ